MATVVTIMDRDEGDTNTDVIVVVDPSRRRLLWVPRDVWSPLVGHRINTAYQAGGPELLLRALGEHGIVAHHSVCVPRATSEALLDGIVVVVPVKAPIRLWYPLHPHTRLQDGRRPVDFDPPRETLTGERVHQWIGGRTSRVPVGGMPDLLRIGRQQVFVRALLRQHVDLRRVREGPRPVEISDPRALDDLRRVRWWWRMQTTDDVETMHVDGMKVLRLRSPNPRSESVARRARRAGRRIVRRMQEHLGRPTG